MHGLARRRCSTLVSYFFCYNYLIIVMVTISLGTYRQCFSVYIHVAYFESKLFKYFWKMALLFKIEVQPLEVRQSYDFVILILVSWVTWGGKCC